MEYKKVGNVAVITLVGEGKESWGTRQEEHRINPVVINKLNQLLDQAEADAEVHGLVLYGGSGRYWCNGLDLNWIDAHPADANALQEVTEQLLQRLLVFPLPTVAAINGHFCAAGAMLGLAFDYRVMNRRHGLFFVPAIDLGLVYSPGMTALMKSKTPQEMHLPMICFAERYTASDLHRLGVVAFLADPDQVLKTAIEKATQLSSKGSTPRYRRTLSAIKRNLYSEACSALWSPGKGDLKHSMGFENRPIGLDRPKSFHNIRSKL
eukprot:gb/GEZN01010977.1/.p1 GENE.gb/GEZN01010977.1/~~gb/GEZN01010977.1/.p1  ORF type:complete len:265 (-),score=19.92 gb/GEZN01010977.1/:317-1111(-)